jgi:glycosyltransferase involved in cell wall biosynthesis
LTGPSRPEHAHVTRAAGTDTSARLIVTDQPLAVALDATPLLGLPTGVGAFCAGVLTALGERADVAARAFAVSWRRRAGIVSQLPSGVTPVRRPMPARPLHAMWGRGDLPPIEWFVGPVDVVHGTNFVVPPTRRAAAVVSVHDLTPVRYPELSNEASLRYPGLIAAAIRRGAWVHTDSAFVAAEVVGAFDIDPSRVRVVAPGVPQVVAAAPRADEKPAQSPGSALPRGSALPAGTTRYILSLGTAEPRKDLPGLVRAFDRVATSHADVALVLAGPPGWGEDELVAALRQTRAAARVVRTGWVPPPAVGRLLAGATVLAYPSRYEGFGFPPLEAMAAGVPVVATRAGSLPEVLGDGASLVEVGDVDGLAAALDRLLSDEKQRESLRAAGAAQVARFSWDRCAAGLVDLYRDALDAHRG